MEKNKVTLWILHAGFGHKSPYFYNLCKELKKHENLEVIVDSELPLNISPDCGIVYFNRLKRYYNSADINSVNEFLNKVDKLKKSGWKLIFTVHNFFPIDRETNNIDELLLKKFLLKMDAVFTFTNYMKKSLKEHFGITAINHSIGINTLNNDFDAKFKIPKFESEDFVFTFIGNICEYKMLDSVIDCFNRINNKHAYLIIAGPDNKFYNLNIPKNNNIIRINCFIGEEGWNKLSKITNVFINTYDINRNCFKYGFFPSTCIQIVNQRKMCIVPKCEEIYEILPKKYYYTYSNNKELFFIMRDLIKRKKEIENMEAKYPYINKYKWEKMVEILLKKIEEIA